MDRGTYAFRGLSRRDKMILNLQRVANATLCATANAMDMEFVFACHRKCCTMDGSRKLGRVLLVDVCFALFLDLIPGVHLFVVVVLTVPISYPDPFFKEARGKFRAGGTRTMVFVVFVVRATIPSETFFLFCCHSNYECVRL